MPILFMCSCGQQLQTGESNAGKLVRCPKCSELALAPSLHAAVQAAPDEQDMEEMDFPDAPELQPLDEATSSKDKELSDSRQKTAADTSRRGAAGSLTTGSSNPSVLPPLEDVSNQFWELSAPIGKPKPPPVQPAAATTASGQTASTIAPFSLTADPAPASTTFAVTKKDIVFVPPSSAQTVYTITDADVITSASNQAAGSATQPAATLAPPQSSAPSKPGADGSSKEVTEVTEDLMVFEDAKGPAGRAAALPSQASLPAVEAQHIQSALPRAAAETLADDSTPILEDEEEGASADGWYDARGLEMGKKQKPKRNIQLEKEHLDLVEEAEGLRKVNLGLSMLHYGILMLMFTFVLGFICLLALIMGAAANTAFGGGSFEHIFVGVMGIFLLALFAVGVCSGLVNLAGLFFCCYAPKKSESRKYVILSLALLVGAGLPFIGAGFMLFVGGVLGPEAAIAGIIAVCVSMIVSYGMVIAAFMCFFMFIRKFSHFVNEDGIAREAMELSFIWLWVSAIGPVLQIIIMIAYLIDFTIFITFGLIVNLINAYWAKHFITQWIRWANMIGSLRKVLMVFYDV